MELGITTQAELSRRTGGAVSQQAIAALETRDSATSKLLPQLAEALQCSMEELLAGTWPASVARAAPPPAATPTPAAAGPRELPAGAHPTVLIQRLDVSASMGPGSEMAEETISGALALSERWVRTHLPTVSSPANLRVISGSGDSMEPTFQDGDLLLVDGGIQTVSVDGVYVLSAHQRLFIKRVRQRLDGHYEISSDNPAVRTVDVLNGGHEVTVHGRVVWAWNGRKL